MLRKREGEIADGKLPGIVFDRVLFDDLADMLIQDYQINKKKSIDRVKNSVKQLKVNFERMRVVDITPSRIQQFIRRRMQWRCKSCSNRFYYDGQTACPKCGSDKLETGKANATINRDLSALKRMLKLGIQQGRVDRAPYIEMLKENNVREGFFKHGEFLKLRNALPFYLRDFVTFAYKTGMRKGEISRLKWDQINLDDGYVRLGAKDTKNNKGRMVYFDDELREMFNGLWDARKESGKILPYVFLDRTGKNRIKKFDKAWKNACRKSGIGVRLFHDFRRTAVRNMVRAGIPEKVAMMISGHKTHSVFERYNIVDEDDLKLAAQMQEAFLNSQTGTISGTVTNFPQKAHQSTYRNH